jgi:TorA maturation chaperone TorD
MSSEHSSTVAFRAYVAAEDHARANVYALLSRLFALPPDQALLKAIAGSPPLPTDDDGAALPLAWSKLIAAASVVDADAVGDEYEALFGGVGRASVNLHGSHHLAGFMMEKPLAELREVLRGFGIARLATQSVVEDHIASLCEIMRILIVGSDGVAAKDIATQKSFFLEHISSWIDTPMQRIAEHPLANFYRVVAQFARSFMQVERESFSINA